MVPTIKTAEMYSYAREKIKLNRTEGEMKYSYLSNFASGFWLGFVYTNTEGTKSGLLESNDASPANKTHPFVN